MNGSENMHYKFPRIRHISQVEKAISGRDEFIIADREGYRVVNYLVAFAETFPEVKTEEDAILRECRGLVFDYDGNVIARRFHKFFNVDEKSETSHNNIDLSKPHVILEKLDGSMITPIHMDEDSYQLASKMGVTDVAVAAETFLSGADEKIREGYKSFILVTTDFNCTPIFEFCSSDPNYRIVVNHPETRLVLLAIRNNETGNYMKYENMKELASYFNIDIVKQYEGTVENMVNLVSSIREEETGEGWVLRFEDGHMVKIKNDLYIAMHRTKDAISQERNVANLIIRGGIDDIKPVLSQEDVTRIEEYEENLHIDIHDFVNEIVEALNYANDNMWLRKDFALNFIGDHFSKNIIFRLFDVDWNREMIVSEVHNLILKHTSNNKRFKEIKHLFPNTNWNETASE